MADSAAYLTTRLATIRTQLDAVRAQTLRAIEINDQRLEYDSSWKLKTLLDEERMILNRLATANGMTRTLGKVARA